MTNDNSGIAAAAGINTAIKMVDDMEVIEGLLKNKGRFVGNMVHISISDLADALRAAQKDMVLVPRVATKDMITAVIKDMAPPFSSTLDVAMNLSIERAYSLMIAAHEKGE